MPRGTPVVLDANALMMPFQFSINIDRELDRLLGLWEGVVPSTVMAELEGLASGRRRPEALAALRLATRYRRIDSEGRGDEAVLRAARELGAHLLTNDAALRKRAQEAGVRVICMRGKNRLALV